MVFAYTSWMLDDKYVAANEPLSSTLWVENELRRLSTDRDAWRNRWQELRTWITKRHEAQEYTTLSMIEHRMNELAKDASTNYTILEIQDDLND